MPTKKQLQEENEELKKEAVYTDFKNMKDERDGLKVRWKELQEENNVFAEEKTNMCVLLTQTIRENEELKEYNEEWFRIYGVEGLLNDLFYDGYTTTKLIGGWNSGEEVVDEVIKSITELKEKIDKLKKQIPDKKGKKLSEADKELLRIVYDDVDAEEGPVEDPEAHTLHLLKRLLK